MNILILYCCNIKIFISYFHNMRKSIPYGLYCNILLYCHIISNTGRGPRSRSSRPEPLPRCCIQDSWIIYKHDGWFLWFVRDWFELAPKPTISTIDICIDLPIFRQSRYFVVLPFANNSLYYPTFHIYLYLSNSIFHTVFEHQCVL